MFCVLHCDYASGFLIAVVAVFLLIIIFVVVGKITGRNKAVIIKKTLPCKRKV